MATVYMKDVVEHFGVVHIVWIADVSVKGTDV